MQAAKYLSLSARKADKKKKNVYLLVRFNPASET